MSDPPRPPKTSPAEIAAGAAVAGLAIVDHATGGFGHTILTISGGGDKEPIDVEALERASPGLCGTAPPQLDADGRAMCTRCSTAVPFGEMSLDEHGYFCAGCAAVTR